MCVKTKAMLQERGVSELEEDMIGYEDTFGKLIIQIPIIY